MCGKESVLEEIRDMIRCLVFFPVVHVKVYIVDRWLSYTFSLNGQTPKCFSCVLSDERTAKISFLGWRTGRVSKTLDSLHNTPLHVTSMSLSENCQLQSFFSLVQGTYLGYITH